MSRAKTQRRKDAKTQRRNGARQGNNSATEHTEDTENKNFFLRVPVCVTVTIRYCAAGSLADRHLPGQERFSGSIFLPDLKLILNAIHYCEECLLCRTL
jgi:hypothetical protein